MQSVYTTTSEIVMDFSDILLYLSFNVACLLAKLKGSYLPVRARGVCSGSNSPQ